VVAATFRSHGARNHRERGARRIVRFGRRGQVSPAREPKDVQSLRPKNTGHGKKTADKWNQ
jgi:hypothetical protein